MGSLPTQIASTAPIHHGYLSVVANCQLHPQVGNRLLPISGTSSRNYIRCWEYGSVSTFHQNIQRRFRSKDYNNLCTLEHLQTFRLRDLTKSTYHHHYCQSVYPLRIGRPALSARSTLVACTGDEAAGVWAVSGTAQEDCTTTRDNGKVVLRLYSIICIKIGIYILKLPSRSSLDCLDCLDCTPAKQSISAEVNKDIYAACAAIGGVVNSITFSRISSVSLWLRAE
jgi:hypothetical protein